MSRELRVSESKKRLFGASLIGGLQFCHPQTVEVAVFICSNGFVVDKFKAGMGLVAGREAYALSALFRFEIDPLDVVGFRHGMLYGADGDMYGIAIHGYNGDVLFGSGVGGVGDEFLHFFTTADEGQA